MTLRRVLRSVAYISAKIHQDIYQEYIIECTSNGASLVCLKAALSYFLLGNLCHHDVHVVVHDEAELSARLCPLAFRNCVRQVQWA